LKNRTRKAFSDLALKFYSSIYLTYFLNCSVVILLHESGWRRGIEGMKVALLGPEGTFTHQAADMYFDNLEPVFCSTIRDVFDSDIEVKFVPIENSLGGSVTDTVDLFHRSDEEITAEVKLTIRHALVSDEESIDDVDMVVSHPQGIAQSQEIIDRYDWDVREASSTAAAVDELGSGEAAFASEIAADLNDKNVLQSSVQDSNSNVTRFFVLNGPEETDEKSAMILEPGEDRPGLLHSMLACFAGHHINLSHIQSRPTKEEIGKYYFYVEAQEGAGETLDNALQCLDTYGDVQVLGSFATVGDEM
jgi:prephenate dehydratase